MPPPPATPCNVPWPCHPSGSSRRSPTRAARLIHPIGRGRHAVGRGCPLVGARRHPRRLPRRADALSADVQVRGEGAAVARRGGGAHSHEPSKAVRTLPPAAVSCASLGRVPCLLVCLCRPVCVSVCPFPLPLSYSCVPLLADVTTACWRNTTARLTRWGVRGARRGQASRGAPTGARSRAHQRRRQPSPCPHQCPCRPWPPSPGAFRAEARASMTALLFTPPPPVPNEGLATPHQSV